MLAAQVSSDVRPLLASCVALGSSLLDTYLPDGNRRPAAQTQAEFQRRVETFFQEAACSNYGTEMFNR